MKLREFRIGWRLLWQEPAYSAMVVFGLAIGFAACFLLLAYVRYSFSYNASIPDVGSIYALQEKLPFLPRPEWRMRAPVGLRDVAARSGLVTEAAFSGEADVNVRASDRLTSVTLQIVDKHFAKMFALTPIEGDLQAALERPDGLAMSAAMAQRLFGQPHAVGMHVIISGTALEVRAILPDQRANTTVTLDLLVGIGSAVPEARQFDGTDGSWKFAAMYVKLAPAAEPAALETLLQNAANNSPLAVRFRDRLPGGAQNVEDIRLRRLSDVYFDPALLASRTGARYGDRNGVIGLAAIALLILLLAALNYVNLAAVRTMRRRREIGLRKVLGARGWLLARQFMAESLMVTMLSTLLGLLLAWLMLPFFSGLVNRQLDKVFTPGSCVAALGFGALVGLASALHPIWIALRLPVCDTLHGRADSEPASGLWMRRGMTMFQLSAALGLISVALAVAYQTHYASQANPGFDPAPLLVMTIPGDPKAASARALRGEISRLPGVAGVATVSEAIGRDGNKFVRIVDRPDGSKMSMEMKLVSPEFFDIYQVRPLYGRVFATPRDGPKSTDVVLNRSASAALGFASPEAAIGQMFDMNRRIIGIAPDLRYWTLRQSATPMFYTIDPDQSVLTVRVRGDSAALRAAVAQVWRRHYPNDILEIESAGGIFAENYIEDRRLAQILSSASAIATALATLGIYVLSAYNVKRRTRKIVVRKIYGASGAQIGGLVATEFIWLTALSAAIGLPLAAYAIECYLAGFVERAPMGAWPLALALAMVGAVAFAATLRQTVAAMRIAPALALRG